MLPDVDNRRFNRLKLTGNCNVTFINQLLYTTTVFTKSRTNLCSDAFPHLLTPSTVILNIPTVWYTVIQQDTQYLVINFIHNIQ